jgi:TPR repeat protein
VIKNYVSAMFVLGIVFSLESPAWAREGEIPDEGQQKSIIKKQKFSTRTATPEFRKRLLNEYGIDKYGYRYRYQGDDKGDVERYREALHCNNPKRQLDEALFFFEKLKKTDFALDARKTGRVIALLEEVVNAEDVDEEVLNEARKNLTLVFLGCYHDVKSEDAKPLLKKLKKQKHANSIYILGQFHDPAFGYYTGAKTHSYEKAAEYYELASSLDHRRATFTLARMYENRQVAVRYLNGSLDSQKTREKALHYYKIVAWGDRSAPDETDGDLRDVKMLALFEYGKILWTDRESSKGKKAEGKKYIQQSAQMGYVAAQQYCELTGFKNGVCNQ